MSIFVTLSLGVLSGMLATALLGVLARLNKRTSARRRWNLTMPHQLRIYVSTSGAVDTERYARPTTGIGQAKALAIISPSLSRGWRSVDMQNVLFPEEAHGKDLESDLILLGGPKTNRVTKDALDALRQEVASMDIAQEDSIIHAGGKAFTGETDEDSITTDYGLIIRTVNPFSPGRNRRLVVLSGCHTYGTIGAARFMVESKLPKKDFAIVVKVQVKDKHALPPTEVWRNDNF